MEMVFHRLFLFKLVFHKLLCTVSHRSYSPNNLGSSDYIYCFIVNIKILKPWPMERSNWSGSPSVKLALVKADV